MARPGLAKIKLFPQREKGRTADGAVIIDARERERERPDEGKLEINTPPPSSSSDGDINSWLRRDTKANHVLKMPASSARAKGGGECARHGTLLRSGILETSYSGSPNLLASKRFEFFPLVHCKEI